MRLPARFAGVRLTARGIAFLVAAGVGLIVAYASGWPSLLAVSLFLAAAVVAAFASVVVAPPEVHVERRIDPPVVEQRRPARVRLSVRGPAAALEWIERTVPDVQVTGQVAGVLRGDGARLLEYQVESRNRGAVPLGPFSVVRTDPLGLARTSRRVGGTDVLTVLPRLHEVVVPTVVTRTDPDSAASSAFGPVGDQRDVVARQYRAGDPMRQVDWRATAHRGELMVRTEAAAAASSTAIALESRTDAWGDAAEFEWALEYTASIAAVLGERRAAVRFASDRHSPVAGDAPGALVALAVVERMTAAPRPAELAARLAATDVRVLHLVTGRGSIDDLRRLPALPHGTTGLVTLVARAGVAPAEVPQGWHLETLDPSSPVGGASA